MKVLRRLRRSVLPAMACVLVAVTWTAPAAIAGDVAVKAFQEAAYSGKFDGGIAKLDAMVRADRNDVEAQFGLGALRFFDALAGLQKELHRHSTPISAQALGRSWARSLRLFGGGLSSVVWVPPNKNATPMTYAKLRQILARFADRLVKAERTLAHVKGRDVKLPLKPFDIAIDLNHNGTIEVQERVLVSMLSGRRGRIREAAFGTELAFDAADASWLRGYSHVFLAFTNFMLAFDFERSYDVVAHNIYGDKATSFGTEMARQAATGRSRAAIQEDLDRVKEQLAEIRSERSSRKDIRELRKHIRSLADTPANAEQRKLLQGALDNMLANQNKHREAQSKLYKERRRLRAERDGGGMGRIFDMVAMIHTLNWNVVEPQRLKAARRHLLQVMEINKTTWRLARAETDDDREWLPNAKQTAPFKSKPVKDDVIDSWLKTTELAAQILRGEKLLPHPRFKKGINLRRMFDTSRRLDFVLLATGHDLLPYLEDGEVVNQKAWDAITQPMGRHVGNYAIWFN